MNFIDSLENETGARTIRAADGGIDFEHYRIRAQRERAAALAAFGERFAGLFRRAGRPARTIETPWIPTATPRRP